MPSVLIINGPNLNLLGTREPDQYGHQTVDDIEAACQKTASDLGLDLLWVQSNHEGSIIDTIQDAPRSHHGLIINAAAYTHSSIAIMDALRAINLPIIEVHLSNIHRREAFRSHSYISHVATGVICGFGAKSYQLAVIAIAAHLEGKPTL